MNFHACIYMLPCDDKGWVICLVVHRHDTTRLCKLTFGLFLPSHHHTGKAIWRSLVEFPSSILCSREVFHVPTAATIMQWHDYKFSSSMSTIFIRNLQTSRNVLASKSLTLKCREFFNFPTNWIVRVKKVFPEKKGRKWIWNQFSRESHFHAVEQFGIDSILI